MSIEKDLMKVYPGKSETKNKSRQTCEKVQKPYTIIVSDWKCFTQYGTVCRTECDTKIDYVPCKNCTTEQEQSATRMCYYHPVYILIFLSMSRVYNLNQMLK